MNKRVFTLLLTVLMSMVSIQAFADWDTYNSVKVDGFYYYLDEDNHQAQLTWSREGKYSGDIVIPVDITYNRKVYSVTSIGKEAFSNCTDLTSVTIPNSVTHIDKNSFEECSLTSITIPNSVKSIGEDAFYYCRDLTTVTIGNGVTSIGEGAFRSCDGLTSVIIGKSVTSYGMSAFYFCFCLTSVTVLNPIPVDIYGDVFSERQNATLYVPQGSKSAYQAADNWKDFKEIVEIDPTKIEQIMNEETPQTTIYTLDGKRIYKPQKGLNIIGGKMILIK